MKRIFSATALALICSSAALSQTGNAPFSIAETGQGFARLSEAVDAIGGGNGTIVIANGTYGDCAVQEDGNITYRAATAGAVIFDGGICEDKATFVLRGKSAVVDGIIFQNLSVADGNGSGIRIEKGNLSVIESLFRDSEEGILSADDPSSHIKIDKSTFSHLGRCDRGLSCAHSIYLGDYGSLTVTRSRFEKGNGGHYVKSRAGKTHITDNSFDDTNGRTTNYMIDLPAGSTGVIAQNEFVQGKNKENHSAIIAVAAEGINHSSNGLSIHSNNASLAAGVSYSTYFVADWSGDTLNIGPNKIGQGIKRFDRR